MFQQRKLNIISCIFALTVLVALVGCSPSAQQSATATPEAISATATSESVVTDEATQAAETTTEANVSVTAECTKLNLNTLTEEDLLTTIPDFSNRMVREFFEYRPYVSIQQFRREIGKYVDENQVAEYEQYVYVPVAINDADADTLMQLPGVDQTVADSLIAGRPYASNDAFLDALTSSVSAEQLAQASCYLDTTA